MSTRFTDHVACIAAIDADAYAAGTYTTGWLASADAAAFAALIAPGDLGASATLDAKLQQATDSSGTGAKDITGKSITQLTQAGSDSNKQVWINLRPEELDLANSFTHFRLSMTVGTATSDAAAYVFSLQHRYGPPSAADASTVDEIV